MNRIKEQLEKKLEIEKKEAELNLLKAELEVLQELRYSSIYPDVVCFTHCKSSKLYDNSKKTKFRMTNVEITFDKVKKELNIIEL